MAEKKTILLRLQPKLWEEISRWSEEEFRSLNGQIEYILHEAVAKRRKSSLGEIKDTDNKAVEKHL
jgi:hypothetical protein